MTSTADDDDDDRQQHSAWHGVVDDAVDVRDVRVWLTRPSRHRDDDDDDDAWQPLWHEDCDALRRQQRQQQPQDEDLKPIHIEHGRATADPVAGVVFDNFVRGRSPRTLTAAVWFKRDGKDDDHDDDANKKNKKNEKDGFSLIPIQNPRDEDKIESLYQNTVVLLRERRRQQRQQQQQRQNQDGTADADIAQISPTITLSDQSQVKVTTKRRRGRGGDDDDILTIALQRTAPGWFGHVQTLQRGYGPYTVPGEDDEAVLGPVRHLVFVIHGIGEAYFTNTSNNNKNSTTRKFVPSMLEQTDTMRRALYRRQAKRYREDCTRVRQRRGATEMPSPPSRTEFIPLEWFHVLRDDDQQSNVLRSLRSVTLSSIPALRTIANDIVFDILVYLTPTLTQTILRCVAEQMATLYAAFTRVHTDFDGHVSFMGHSLGSVICWDLLTLYQEVRQQQQQRRESSSSSSSTDTPTWGPSLPDKTALLETGVLPVTPHSVLLLGSPLGMFLSLRNAHEAFDALRRRPQQDNDDDTPQKGRRSSRISPLTLPITGRFVNIFNASDPVAYRLEPLLLPPDDGRDDMSPPPPAYLTAPGQDVRFHVKARQLGDSVRKSLMRTVESPSTTWSAVWDSVVSTATEAAAATTTTTSSKEDTTDAASSSTAANDSTTWKFPLGGTSDRVDYAFQPALVDNEYISAVLAHSTTAYLGNGDFLDYLAHTMT